VGATIPEIVFDRSADLSPRREVESPASYKRLSATGGKLFGS